MRIRLSDVARHAGVSNATASMALRAAPGIAATTVERVRKAADELGYLPDAAAQALAKSGNRAEQGAFYGTLGVLTNTDVPQSEGWAAATGASQWETVVAEVASELGYAVNPFPFPRTPAEAASLLRQLQARNIRGLLIEANSRPLPEVKFDWTSFATIMISPPPDEIPFHCISSHSTNETYTAVMRCHRRGYRRIGLVADMRRFTDWVGGFDMAALRLGLRKSALFLDMPDWDEDAFLRWFEKRRPDVVIANQDDRPLKVLAARGLSAPVDYGYCCLDLPPYDTPLSGFLQLRRVRNRLAVELLHRFLRRKEFGLPDAPLAMSIGLEWVEGATLRAEPATAG